MADTKSKKKNKKNIPSGVAHIKASFNNTIINIISGTGAGRETAVRTLQNMGMDVGTIKDITPTPHNGCRPKKRRRG